MLSTRLTGSSTSITSVSRRSAASTAVSAPGADMCCGDEFVRGVCGQVPLGVEHLGHLGVGAVEERPGVGGDGLGRRPTPASGGYQW